MADPATGSDVARPGSLQAAANALEGLLDPETDNQKVSKGPTSEEATETEDPSAESQPDEETEPTEEAESDESEEPKSEEDDDQPTESLYTVTIDGKEEQVGASELIAGYQRNQSYTRKSMALAEERKAFESDRASIQQQRQEYAQLIPQLRKALEVPEPNWAELKAKDPAAYAATFADWQQHQGKISALKAEEQRIAAQQQEEWNKSREAVLIEQRNALLGKLPAWKDPKVASQEASEIRAVLESVGFSGDELQVYDHRALILARMAAKYAKGLSGRASITQKRADAAPVVKSGAGPAKKVVKGSEELKRFHKSGSIKDAAAAFEQFL